MNMEPIAERQLICENANGERHLVTLRIGKPYPASDVDWACACEIEGLYTRLHDQHGIDSFQALALAQNLLRQLMTSTVEDGSCFRSIYDDSVVDLTALFAQGL